MYNTSSSYSTVSTIQDHLSSDCAQIANIEQTFWSPCCNL